MTIELVLSIASFALSIGGLVSIFFVKKKESIKNLIVIAIIIAALIPTTGIVFYRLHQYDALVKHVKEDISQKLLHHVWTFDQIYNELHYVTYPVVSEALFRSVEEGSIGHKVIEFRGNEGDMQQVKVYYLQPNTK